jgi:pimeloyl-ACP methyl ester carboxylesterase
LPYIDRDGVRIYYEDEGRGPALLLTHGYSATLRMWEPQVVALANRYRVLRWDMRGHGASDSPEDPAAYTHAATVADMAAVLDAAGVDRAVIGGLSLGGYMSLAFHLARPERVRALVLCDTGPGYKKDDARESWNRYAESFARKYDENGLDALGSSAEVRVARHRSAAGPARAARGILVQRDARVIESLAAIRVPTLLVVGSEDKPFLTGMRYMADKIAGSVHAVIEGAGHAPNLEKPAEFNDVLARFLDALPDR